MLSEGRLLSSETLQCFFFSHVVMLSSIYIFCFMNRLLKKKKKKKNVIRKINVLLFIFDLF